MPSFQSIRLGSLWLLVMAIAGCSQPIKNEINQTPVSQTALSNANTLPVIEQKAAVSQADDPQETDSIPIPDSQGNYTVSKRRPLHRQWEVVDPEGVNCRMPQQFQWRLFGESSDRSLGYSTIAEELLQDNQHNPLDWSVMTIIPKGAIINAYGGNLGALILVRDRRNQTWLPVKVKQGNRSGNCFVRANQNFIKPVKELAIN
ncbi:MAG: hypothetical protein ACK47D_19160 [Pseudanabaena sp.]|jgi:hypothetical protein|nr:hypothetical protein [Pseudanabaena sp. M53BS1SP1A06MG]MCA6584077.1 hypothetical protein [Pseudanabaena sp. M34BS1SP1A06MG]MCA6592323.1 hypothetical protein [Pseudanabaena sp. M38BS1SP1A06MG]MCA6595521.1 hypothetical protein [Pseudanabaena sp. M046S1SP1A06QC]MCA6602703.1 hypothetical protein [Pseudanabaena sp. M57BS1SP1A06MG]